MKYLRIKHGKAYWEPKQAYVVGGVLTPLPKSLRARALGPANAESMQMAESFLKAIKEWRSGEQRPGRMLKGSFNWLAAEFYKDEMYASISKKSQKEYKRVIEKELLPIFDGAPAEEVKRKDARALYHDLRASKRLRLAEYVMMVGRRLFKFGLNIDVVSVNPFTEMEVKRNKPRDQIWSDDQIDKFKVKALEEGRRSMWLAVIMASTIGTDSQTTRLFARSYHLGNKLSFTRSKSGVKVNIPLADLPELKAALDGTPKESIQFVTNEQTKKAYTDTNFSHVFREIATAAGLPKELQFKDLRRTAVGNLHKAGCEILEIAAIVGWAPAYCTQIVRHYFTDTEETAGNAIVKLVRKNASGKKLETGEK